VKKIVSLVAVGLLVAGASTLAQAHVTVGIGIGFPGYYAPPPVVYAPAPVYVQPPVYQQGYYAPAPVYAAPPVVYAAPPPVYYGRPYYGGGYGYRRY